MNKTVAKCFLLAFIFIIGGFISGPWLNIKWLAIFCAAGTGVSIVTGCAIAARIIDIEEK